MKTIGPLVQSKTFVLVVAHLEMRLPACDVPDPWPEEVVNGYLRTPKSVVRGGGQPTKAVGEGGSAYLVPSVRTRCGILTTQ